MTNKTRKSQDEKFSFRPIKNYRQDKPPVVFTIVVPGVGLEPTKACARGS